MRILYAAIDQSVPGAHGGAVHVTSVAEGLAERGHEVHAFVSPGTGAFPPGLVHWHAMRPPVGARQLRFLRATALRRMAHELRPDVIVERYYNFGGEGIVAAQSVGALPVLEVNAPVVDYPGSPKQRLDALLLFKPMQRWREWQCRSAGLIVTPSAKIVPDFVPRSRVLEIEWGADTDRFRPDVRGAVHVERNASDTVVVFAGAFRAWHGAQHLVEAIRQLRVRGRRDIKAVLIGDGPELTRTREAAAGVDGITFPGPRPHGEMPAWLAAADIGVAPFDITRHPSLEQEFHWSPLKVFEYMASGLPVVAPHIPRLARIVRHEQEGLLYDAHDSNALAGMLEQLANAPALRTRLGAAARARVVQTFSWQRHCEALDRAMSEARSACAS